MTSPTIPRKKRGKIVTTKKMPLIVPEFYFTVPSDGKIYPLPIVITLSY
ncbi:hypothetical protein XCR1_940011 [Xenorhabdus cabanillasii JM26]|uniref:Uncharacterized protein n=1 Tax=Xenorhabdus cabanillasii JM26 TaxID=1427517 RepID=W1JCP5_9GAMM|nr:hypothetical protein XCR1_940011 [Xenorhabdus cabanillasii JM26]